MISKNSQGLSKREKFLIAAFFTAALLCCFFRLGGISSVYEIRALYLEQTQVKAEIEQLNAIIYEGQQIAKSYKETAPDRQRLEKLIPSIDQQPASIGNLENLFYSGTDEPFSVRINEKIDYGEYSAQNITVKIVKLPYFPSDLILQLENFPQLLVIEQIDWQAGETQEATINLSLSLYFLN